ncbi:MAG: hypothetical protein FJ224_05745 [Lentisphaerae bacterium]|nr:hypothetical protein [Lentisphaerota bacterium]
MPGWKEAICTSAMCMARTMLQIEEEPSSGPGWFGVYRQECSSLNTAQQRKPHVNPSAEGFFFQMSGWFIRSKPSLLHWPKRLNTIGPVSRRLSALAGAGGAEGWGKPMRRPHFMLICVFAMLCAGVAAAGIHDAVKEGDYKLVRAFLAGPDASAVANLRASGGSTPLHWAALYSRDDMVKPLIKAGADVNATTDNGYTPLHWAANKNAAKIAGELIRAGADVNSLSPKGYTPLHWAAITDARDVAELLISKKAMVDARSHDGITPLHIAVKKDAVGVVELLIKKGADPVAAASDGTTALQWAASDRMKELLARALPQPRERVSGGPEPSAGPIAERGGSARSVGSVVMKGGVKYVGEMGSGVPDGRGRMEYPDGAVYEGNFTDGVRNGSGVYAFAGGDVYSGEWSAGLFSGKGVYLFANGGKVEATWSKGRMLEGSGSVKFANDDTYEGAMRLGRLSGDGRYVCADGRVFQGTWIDNRYIGAATDPSGLLER